MPTKNIQDLPGEVLVIIATFLSRKDLETCFNVCTKWRSFLNLNQIWKRCCIYPEKYFRINFGDSLQCKDQQYCTWRRYYNWQKRLWLNWSKGQYEVKKSNIKYSSVSSLMDYVDSHGNHWLFDSNSRGIKIWNIKGTPVLHREVDQFDQVGILPLKDKLLTYRSNYIKIFHFGLPDYEVKLQYRFRFNASDVIPENEVVSDDEYTSGVRFIVMYPFFVGYNEKITDINSVFLHIWNLNLGNKVATQNVFQESFVSYIQSSVGCTITNSFSGGLLIFAGDTDRFLVTLIDDTYDLCQISLFSLEQMNVVNVVARLRSRTVSCSLKGDIVTIFHLKDDSDSQISVYNVNGVFLAELDFPFNHNPTLNDEFWFSGNRVFLKVYRTMNVINIIEALTAPMVEIYDFEIGKDYYILTYFDPKFLITFHKGVQGNSIVWDVASRTQLWVLGRLFVLDSYKCLFNNMEYPGRIIVLFEDDEEMSILNFENKV